MIDKQKKAKKATPSETLIFVYNISGQLVAEYKTSTVQDNGTSDLTSDMLGTPRAITKADGTLSARHDYLPFGEEILAGVGGRTNAVGYDSTHGLRQKWTGKERDVETGLDYFGARYYGSTLGRFASVDPIKLTVARLFDPQRINLYVYCRNNPLKYLDPDGQDLILANATAVGQARANIDANLRANERANVKINGYKVELVDEGAIDKATASAGYKYLAAVIENSRVINYFGIQPGEIVKATAGNTVTSADVGAGMIQFNENGADVFVPVGSEYKALGENNVDMVELPEHIVWGHEVLGHGTCGLGQCAVDVENELRKEQGLPIRSGLDHGSEPGERPGNTISASQNADPPAHTDLVDTSDTSLGTTFTPRPLIPVPPPSPPPR